MVRPIDDGTHLGFLESLPTASFLQTPAWGRVKTEWRAESIGWFDVDALVGAALVLHRRLPRLRRSLAYLPEGPVIDWTGEHRDYAEVELTRFSTGASFVFVDRGRSLPLLNP